MGPKAGNWSIYTELPPFNYELFNSEEPPFKASLLPGTSVQRKIRISCLLCVGPKPYYTIRDQYNYKQTSNYWLHL